MEDYVSYKDIPSLWKLKKGDVIYISSDITRLASVCHDNGELFDINIFIDKIIDAVGENGTVLFPTFNWDFCHQVPFNYKKTKSKSGLMGHVAMKRRDFKRTRHPLYSFAVAGKDQDLLYNMDNIQSFGPDSPFAYLERTKGYNIIIDVPYSKCFTFKHYVEQKIGVPYRYEKMFTGEYIDENGNTSIRSYSMYVRDMDLDVDNDMTGMGNIFEAEGVSRKRIINGIPFCKVDLASCVPLIEHDIKFNRSKNICKYKNQ